MKEEKNRKYYIINDSTALSSGEFSSNTTGFFVIHTILDSARHILLSLLTELHFAHP